MARMLDQLIADAEKLMDDCIARKNELRGMIDFDDPRLLDLDVARQEMIAAANAAGAAHRALVELRGAAQRAAAIAA